MSIGPWLDVSTGGRAVKAHSPIGLKAHSATDNDSQLSLTCWAYVTNMVTLWGDEVMTDQSVTHTRSNVFQMKIIILI